MDPAVAHLPPPVDPDPAPPILGRDWKLAYAFVVPLVLILVLLVAYPFVTGIMLSFQNKTIGGDARWVGTSNYQELLFGEQYSSLFWNSVRVSPSIRSSRWR